MQMNFLKHNLHLDPGTPDGGNGGGAPAEPAPAGDGGAPAAPSFDPAAFKTELMGSIRSELGSGFQRFRSEIEPRLTPAQQARAEENTTAPSMKDKKYLNDQGELDADGYTRWQTDFYKHMSKAEKAEWLKEYEQNQSKQQGASTLRTIKAEHLSREAEYSKTNPTYQQDLAAAGDMEVNPSVGQRILASKFSANIIHYFAKNRAEFVKFQAESYDDPAGAIETLGELRAKFAGSPAPTNNGIPPKPTKNGFGGTGAGKGISRSTDEIIKDWRN